LVSHELKTPLTSLKGYVQVLASKINVNKDVFTQLIIQKVKSQVLKMETMISSFLNLSHLEAGKIRIETKVLSLIDLIKQVVQDIEIITQSHPIVIKTCPELFVSGDRHKLSQVLANLLSNAAKYSPKASKIEVSCEVFEGHPLVKVRDEGMGIRQKDLPKLFDRYYRVESQEMKNTSGFGLGLYLSKEIIELHGVSFGPKVITAKALPVALRYPCSIDLCWG